jgi:LmbE family N-acetylglucosaminyl deacetylase
MVVDWGTSISSNRPSSFISYNTQAWEKLHLNILAFFAHPDDETILSGGTLALLGRSGVHVHYLCATRGEGGETGEPSLCDEADLGSMREQELVCAAERLGASSLTFLDYIDPRVGPDQQLYAYTQNLTLLAGQVATSIRQFAIDAVITHGSNGEYRHPAHVLTHQAGRIAVESFGKQAPLLYTVQAAFPEHPWPRIANQDDPAHLVLDITPALAEKTQAALCHRTQHALFVRRRSQAAGRQLSVPEVIQRLESLHRVLPPVNDPVEDGLSMLLKPYEVN